MKVLHLLHQAPPVHLGGTELAAASLAAAQRARGYEVALVAASLDPTLAEGEWREGEALSVRLLERGHRRRYADLSERIDPPGAAEALAALVRRERPELVHVHHLLGWGPASVAAVRRAGAAVVWTLHDAYALCERATLLRADGGDCAPERAPRCVDCLAGFPLADLEVARADPSLPRQRARLRAHRAARDRAVREALAAADLLAAPSRHAAGWLERAGWLTAGAVCLLPGGSDLPPGPTARRPPGAPATVGFIGSLAPHKGALVFARALARLDPERVRGRLAAPLEWFPDETRRVAQALGPQRREALLGRLEPSERAAFYAGLDALVVPSLWDENAPLVILEARRSGVPVIASDRGALREHVRDGVDGLRFPPGDEAALAERLARLAADPALGSRLAAAAPRTPSWDEVASRAEGLYREALSGSGGSGSART